jgi:hypothetical protein
MSYPSQWTDEKSREYVSSKLKLTSSECVICKPCRNDISKLTKNESFIPRWDRLTKKKGMKCCSVINCCEAAQHQTNVSIDDGILFSANIKLESLNDSAMPLCSHHYHLIYNLQQPSQTHCITCNMWLKQKQCRLCPEPQIVEELLKERTDFSNNIRQTDKVCFSCYKSHLNLLKCDNGNTLKDSKDEDLQATISMCKLALLQKPFTQTAEDVLEHAMIKTTIDVGNNLLLNNAMLLPVIHTIFDNHVQNLTANESLCDIYQVTSRWILIQLSDKLNHHMISTCKIRKHGTLIYRRNSDLLLVISHLLWKERNNDRQDEPAPTKKLDNNASTSSESSPSMSIVLSDC